MTRPVIGVDIGGTGARALVRAEGAPTPFAVDAGIRVAPSGVTIEPALEAIVTALAAAGLSPDAVGAVCIGMTGLIGLADVGELHRVCTAAWPAATVVCASDAVTANAAALGAPHGDDPAGGVVVVAGTGAIALGTDWEHEWSRADGWGQFLGDCGGGAWIGARGLDAALRAADGRGGGSDVLLLAAEEAFGPVSELPRRVYPADDRARMLAGFASDVAAAARGGDGVASRILREAGEALADTAVAALRPAIPARIRLLGGVVGMGRTLTDAFLRQAAWLRPGVEAAVSDERPVVGALRLAEAVAAGSIRVRERSPYVYRWECDDRQ